MTATIYNSSSGPKEIAGMNYMNLKNGAAKLRRENRQLDEAEAMEARLALLDAERAETVEREPEGVAVVAAPALPETHQIGANNPPPDDPFEAHRVHIDDLYTEAKNWCDGADIENAEQAAMVDRLIDDFKAAIVAAETSRDEAKKPFQDKVTEIQEQYYPLLFDGKTRTKGIAIRAKAALLAVKTKWQNKVDAERAADAKRLLDEAAAKAREAATVAREAVGNIEAQERAEDVIKDAQDALRTAQQASKPLVGTGMRDNWVIAGFENVADPVTGEVTDGRLLLFRHFWKTDKEVLINFCLDLARAEIRMGKRTIPGLVIENQRRAV